MLDTLEVLFASLPNEAILRSELRRLFRWLKDKGVTAPQDLVDIINPPRFEIVEALIQGIEQTTQGSTTP